MLHSSTFDSSDNSLTRSCYNIMVDFITYPEISYLYDEFMMVRSITLRLFFSSRGALLALKSGLIARASCIAVLNRRCHASNFIILYVMRRY